MTMLQLLVELSKCSDPYRRKKIRDEMRKLRRKGKRSGSLLLDTSPLTEPQCSDKKVSMKLWDLYYILHKKLVEQNKWRLMDDTVYKVRWTPWGCWKYTGYKSNNKIMTLHRSYSDPESVVQCHSRYQKASKKGGVWATAFSFKANKSLEKEHTLGGCLSTLILRKQDDFIYPLVLFRTVEITRRLIADLVLLHNLFDYILGDDYQKIRYVQLVPSVIWLPTYHAYLASKIIPDLLAMTNSHYFNRPRKEPAYAQERRALKLADSIKLPMFKGSRLHPKNRKSDFPKSPYY